VAAVAPNPNPDMAAGARGQVLVADDDAWIRRMIATVLERRGYRVDMAGDGQRALALAVARPPDLVITDAVMPVMDGWELVKALRAQPAFSHVPVIFLTALSSAEDRIRGFRLGADDYVTKPFRFEELDLRIERTLQRTRAIMQETRAHMHGVGLCGDLEQVGLAGLLALIELERKTGRLTLRSSDGLCAHLVAREGRIIQAEIEGAGQAAADGGLAGHRTRTAADAGARPAADLDCVHRVMAWGAGQFEFMACAVDGPDRLQRSITHLLLEGARLMDEARRTG